MLKQKRFCFFNSQKKLSIFLLGNFFNPFSDFDEKRWLEHWRMDFPRLFLGPNCSKTQPMQLEIVSHIYDMHIKKSCRSWIRIERLLHHRSNIGSTLFWAALLETVSMLYLYSYKHKLWDLFNFACQRGYAHSISVVPTEPLWDKRELSSILTTP